MTSFDGTRNLPLSTILLKCFKELLNEMIWHTILVQFTSYLLMSSQADVFMRSIVLETFAISGACCKSTRPPLSASWTPTRTTSGELLKQNWTILIFKVDGYGLFNSGRQNIKKKCLQNVNTTAADRKCKYCDSLVWSHAVVADYIYNRLPLSSRLCCSSKSNVSPCLSPGII